MERVKLFVFVRCEGYLLGILVLVLVCVLGKEIR
jgi:hypothetical protein